MMLVSMIQDLDACTSDAGFFRVGRTEGRTDKPILGVGCTPDACIQDAFLHDACIHDAYL